MAGPFLTGTRWPRSKAPGRSQVVLGPGLWSSASVLAPQLRPHRGAGSAPEPSELIPVARALKLGGNQQSRSLCLRFVTDGAFGGTHLMV